MRNQINIHTIRNDTLLGTLKFVSKTQDHQIYGALIPDDMINQDIKDSKAYKTYPDFATRKATPKKARKFKKVASPSKKLSPVLEEEPAEKPKRAKKPDKKSTNVPTAGVVIRYSCITGSCLAQENSQKSKLETHKLHASGSGDEVGSQPKVPDKSKDKTTSTDEGTVLGDSDDDRNDDDSDYVTNDDDDNVDSHAGGGNEASVIRTPDSYGFIDDDEEYEELYKDVNVRLKDVEHEEEGKGDAEMTDAGFPFQSSFISSDFANQFLNLDNVPPTDSEVVSMMNVKVRHEEPSTQTPPLLNIPVTVIPETSTAAAPIIPPIISPITPLPQQSTLTPTPAPTTATTTTSINTLQDFSSLFGFD
ncbi:hypothetical protein Tco_0960017 [Tanacetum coccineum]